jgi:hypothetical protein
MTITFVRNLRSPLLTATWSAHATVVLVRELLKLNGWTDITLDADAAWASCLILDQLAGANGFTVSALSPRIITDQNSPGRFTQAMVTGDYSFFLRATNIQNRGAWRMTRFIDANNIEISANGTPPYGWANETNMPARIINVNAARLATSKGVLMQAPTGNFQFRIYHSSTSACLVFCRPKGGVPLATEIPAAGYGVANGTDTWLCFNVWMEGRNAFISWSSAGGLRSVQIGELDSPDSGDANPGFIWPKDTPGSTHYATTSAYMLNFSDVEITMYPSFIKPYSGDSYTAMLMSQEMRRLQNGSPGQLALRIPRMYGGNIAANACYRGKIPLVRFANMYLDSYRPVDSGGDWLYMTRGLVLPRNGPNDRLPVVV